MIFKLEAADLEKALKLKGACVFEPMAGRKMNGWAQVPFSQKTAWRSLTKKAYSYVKEIKAK